MKYLFIILMGITCYNNISFADTYLHRMPDGSYIGSDGSSLNAMPDGSYIDSGDTTINGLPNNNYINPYESY